MFTANKTNNKEANQKEGSINLIGSGTEIAGDILTKGDVRIDGRINGHISSKAKVVIGSGGQVDGDVTCQTAEISGLVNGNLSASEILFLKTSARIKGDISASKLVVENGAVFTGHCHIGAGFTKPEIIHAKPEARQAAKTPQREEALNNYTRYTGLGFQMMAIIGIFAFIGYQIDKYFQHQTQWVTALSCVLGVCVSIYQTIRQLKE